MIQFNQIPGNLRVPFMRVEVNAGRQPYQSIARLLLIGQKLTAGTAAANIPLLVTGGEDGLFGQNSMLANMYKTARRNAPFQEIWAIPLADAVGATAAAGSIVVATAPSSNGSIVVYIGGARISVPVTTTMDTAAVATALRAAINECQDIDVVAAGATNSVSVTAINKGTLGNFIRIETKLSPDDGELADNHLTITQLTAGAGDPTITAALASLGSEEFDWIVLPYSSDAMLDEVEALLDSRWGPMEQTYGHVISAATFTSAGLAVTAGTARNSWHSTLFAMKNSPQAPFRLAAALGAVCAAHLQDAPELSRPLQTLPLRGIRPPKLVSDYWTVTERQSFYYAGISAYHVGPGSVVQLDRIVTTYQRNAWNSRDASWLDINTPAQLMYGLRSLVAGVTQQYPRAALMDENPGNIQGVATPRDLRNAVVHEYRKLETLGVFENSDLFAELLIVERNESDANRVDMYLPLDHVNQLRVIAVNATTFMQLEG